MRHERVSLPQRALRGTHGLAQPLQPGDSNVSDHNEEQTDDIHHQNEGIV